MAIEKPGAAWKVKLDEDLSPLVAEPLVAAGYEVTTVVGQGWSGLTDSELWPHLVSDRVFFITADTGFSDIRAFPPGSHQGILLLHPDRESLMSFRDLVADVLRRQPLESLAGTVTVARFGNVRIRREPAPDAERD